MFVVVVNSLKLVITLKSGDDIGGDIVKTLCFLVMILVMLMFLIFKLL